MLAEITKPDFFAGLSEKTTTLCEGLKQAANQAGISLTTNHVGAMFGFFFSQEDKITNYQQVMACDVNERRLGMAEQLGADVSVNPQEIDLEEAVHARSDGYGMDVVCEYTGSPEGFDATSTPRSKT